MMNVPETQHEPLPRATYLLLLLSADNGQPIVGRTRLEKLAFLVQKKTIEGLRVGVTTDAYRFRAFHYGPFTEEVFDDAAALRMLNLISITGEEDTTQCFTITEAGAAAVKRLMDTGRITDLLHDEIRRIKVTYGRLSLDQLIARVYQEFPEYTEKSQIRDRFMY